MINEDIMERMQDIFSHVLGKWGCELSEYGAEEDHVHLLIEALFLVESLCGNHNRRR